MAKSDNPKTYTVFVTGILNPTLNIRKGEYEPTDSSLVSVKVIQAKPSEIAKIAEDMFANGFDNGETPKGSSNVKIGDVVTHSDGGEVNHRGVIIGIKDEIALLVVCTTNPFWNKKARQATEDELRLFGFAARTYIAPITRSIRELYGMGYSFPRYRIDELSNEFGDNLC